MAKTQYPSWIDPDRSVAQSPAATFLASVSMSSKRTMHQSLARLAALVVEDAGSADSASERKRSAGKAPNRKTEDVDPMLFRWENLRRADTTRLRVELKGRYAPSTANKMLSALRGVLRACRDMKLMSEADFQAAASLESVKAATRKAERETPVNDVIITRLFEACAQDQTAAGRRDAAMLAIFLSSGLRRAEVNQIDVGDYDPKTGRLHVRGERPEYDRLVVLGPPARRAMKDWLAIRSQEPGPLILPVDRGGIIRFRRMTDQAVYDIFSRILARARIEGLSLRDLRRAYVISLIRAGKAMKDVQYLTGHASWFTTKTYEDLAQRQEQEGYDMVNLPYKRPEGGHQ